MCCTSQTPRKDTGHRFQPSTCSTQQKAYPFWKNRKVVIHPQVDVENFLRASVVPSCSTGNRASFAQAVAKAKPGPEKSIFLDGTFDSSQTRFVAAATGYHSAKYPMTNNGILWHFYVNPKDAVLGSDCLGRGQKRGQKPKLWYGQWNLSERQVAGSLEVKLAPLSIWSRRGLSRDSRCKPNTSRM